MDRARALKVVLVLVGLLFVASAYPMLVSLWRSPRAQEQAMMMSLYVTLGVFLLVAARDPAAHRSLIAYAAWSNLAHAAVMAAQSIRDVSARGELLLGVAIFGVIGLVLLLMMPTRQAAGRVFPAGV